MTALTFTPLALETRSALPTNEAAFHLLRKNQTLRLWHCQGRYPEGLRPQVINGRLAWPVLGIKLALGIAT
jgi:hypothetical protein